jgi:hypothetical protein
MLKFTAIVLWVFALLTLPIVFVTGFAELTHFFCEWGRNCWFDLHGDGRDW